MSSVSLLKVKFLSLEFVSGSSNGAYDNPPKNKRPRNFRLPGPFVLEFVHFTFDKLGQFPHVRGAEIKFDPSRFVNFSDGFRIAEL